MFAKVKTAGLSGIEGYILEVESDVQNGIPQLSLTGALSSETKEAQYRILNAMRNSGISMSPKKITVNFSPAYLRKEGTYFDLPIAVAILSSLGTIDPQNVESAAFIGELGLDGSLKFVRGMLPLSAALAKNGIRKVVVPMENAEEAALPGDMTVVGARSLSAVIDYLTCGEWEESDECRVFGACASGGDTECESYDVDFSEVHGQEYLKRAAEIAVSGMHNILFSGPAGTGKTMIAKRIPTIMPALTRDEDLEISMVYSVSGQLPKGRALLGKRPFRSPHHSISAAAFAGGGALIMPGEISLSSGGILFLDELTLFPSTILEIMRQPMEDGKITITRVRGSYTYPARFMLVAAMNNCPCGFWPDRAKCTCTPAKIRSYTGRLSKPLLERIDIMAEARNVDLGKFLNEERCESSADIRKRVERAVGIQKDRFKHEEGIDYNSQMGVRETERYCTLGAAEEKFVREIFRVRGLSGRTYHKILKVARTIADMEESERIRESHLLEAADLRRSMDKIFDLRGL